MVALLSFLFFLLLGIVKIWVTKFLWFGPGLIPQTLNLTRFFTGRNNDETSNFCQIWWKREREEEVAPAGNLVPASLPIITVLALATVLLFIISLVRGFVNLQVEPFPLHAKFTFLYLLSLFYLGGGRMVARQNVRRGVVGGRDWLPDRPTWSEI